MNDTGIACCPICSSPKGRVIAAFDCGNMDRSRLYGRVRLRVCESCGHAFNELTDDERNGLACYYNDEYAPANIKACGLPGDRPGSADSLTMHRYGQLYDVLCPYINPEQKVLDVGCAMGGFLEFLRQKGFSSLYGVDMTRTYVEQAEHEKPFRIELGNAESLPFGEKSFDLIIMDQVLEHVFNPANAFKEAARVLKDNGFLCIGVPDAARYSEFFFFNFYWLLLREHIQHFDVVHLNMLAEQHGFEMLASHAISHAVMSDKMIMPNLYAVFCMKNAGYGLLESDNLLQALGQRMNDYVINEKVRMKIISGNIQNLANSGKPVYIWGIGREFLFLYESAGLKQCNIAGLIDMNPMKRDSGSVNRMKISDTSVLDKAGRDSVVIITAVAHSEPIRKELTRRSFQGEIIDLFAL